MPDDVSQALERFQQFIGSFEAAQVIDERSGFSVSDAMLLVGEVELATRQHSRPGENPID